LYINRIDAGKILLEEILKRGLATSLSFVFAIPRGGIEVAYPIAEGIGKRIVPVVVHKIPSSINEEFAIGAISVFGDITLTRLYHFKNMKVTINQYFKVIYFKT